MKIKFFKRKERCVRCNGKLDDFYIGGKRVGTVAIYKDPNNSYCSLKCYMDDKREALKASLYGDDKE